MIEKLPWLRRLKKTDPEPPLRLPIACGAVSNGEGFWPDTPRKALIRKLVHDKAEEVARREGVDRREFLASACGMATTLYMINLVNGCADRRPEPSGSTPGAGPQRTDAAPTGDAGQVPPADSVRAGAGAPGPDAGTHLGIPQDGGSAGGFAIPDAAMVDPELAACVLGNDGDELIVDMQLHTGSFSTSSIAHPPTGPELHSSSRDRYPWLVGPSECLNAPQCYDRNAFINGVLLGSDTSIAVVSGHPYRLGPDGSGDAGVAVLTNEDSIGLTEFLGRDYPGRVLGHAMVMPNDRPEVQWATMERLHAHYANWKTYTPWDPERSGTGYWLDRGVGPEMLQRGLDLGAPIFCVHKGLPLPGTTAGVESPTSPRDVGPAANMFPDAHLVIYHSAFEHGMAGGESSFPMADPMAESRWGPGAGSWPEGPYDEQDPEVMGLYPLDRGVNSLIRSLRVNNIGPNGTRLDGSSGPTTHVYAECGSVWPNLMTGRVEEAMHYWGKLLLHVGEDRILWGTDCLWYGSPQPCIEAFRAFEISEQLQESYGYPALTPLRKAKILGLNAARLQSTRPGVQIDACRHSEVGGEAQARRRRELDVEWGRRRDMLTPVRGPRTRREFLRLARMEHEEKLRWSGMMPG